MGCGKINRDHPNEDKQKLLIHSLLKQEISHHYLCLTETQRQAKQWEGFIVDMRSF